MKLLLDRTEYADEATLGALYVDGRFICFSLEDEIAINGAKDPGNTCIPDGKYPVLITWSPRFKRRLPLLINVPEFDGIRIHPGNTEKDTNGCILVGDNLIRVSGKPYLKDSRDAFERLFALLDTAHTNGEPMTIEVIA